jgi:hypothetical protein
MKTVVLSLSLSLSLCKITVRGLSLGSQLGRRLLEATQKQPYARGGRMFNVYGQALSSRPRGSISASFESSTYPSREWITNIVTGWLKPGKVPSSNLDGVIYFSGFPQNTASK